MTRARHSRNRLAAANRFSASGKVMSHEPSSDLRCSRVRIGAQLTRTTTGNVCFLEAMLHTLPTHKQTAFCAGKFHPKERWNEALRFLPPNCQRTGFQPQHVRKYLQFLKERSFIKGYVFKKAKQKGGITSFTLGRITEGMTNYPEKYPHGIILLGSAPRSDLKPKLRSALVSAVKTFETSRRRRIWRPYSALRIRRHRIQLYQTLPLPHGDLYTHACGVANTLDEDSNPVVGLYDNGRPSVVAFSVEAFRVSLMRFWAAYFFDVDI